MPTTVEDCPTVYCLLSRPWPLMAKKQSSSQPEELVEHNRCSWVTIRPYWHLMVKSSVLLLTRHSRCRLRCKMSESSRRPKEWQWEQPVGCSRFSNCPCSRQLPFPFKCPSRQLMGRPSTRLYSFLSKWFLAVYLDWCSRAPKCKSSLNYR